MSDTGVPLAVRAANAIGVDFAGVDLLPTESGWMVLELNGAVDFDRLESHAIATVFGGNDIDDVEARHVIKSATAEGNAKDLEVFAKMRWNTPGAEADA